MEQTKILPTVLMVIDIIAALVYLKCGDYKHFGYWVSAACIVVVSVLCQSMKNAPVSALFVGVESQQ
jgi:hypothetical protein